MRSRLRPDAPRLRRSRRAQWWGLALVCLLLARPLPAQITGVRLPEAYPVLQVANQIWVGSPHGLYQYSREDDALRQFPLPGGRAAPTVRFLYYHKEWLWCVLDTGLAALQVRLNDWLVFDTSNGLPAPVVTGLDFQGDYVWASTAGGLARFDLLIEQWEQIGVRRGLPDPNVRDIRADPKLAWMIAGRDLAQYDPEFEKWRQFKVLPDTLRAPRRLFFLADELWLVSPDGLVRFIPQLERSQVFLLPFLDAHNLIELYPEGDRIWAVTRLGLFTYEKHSGVWQAFEGNNALEGETVLYAQVIPSQILVTTERTTLLWDRQRKVWEFLDYSSGLSSAGYVSAATDGDLTILFTSSGLEYRRTQASPWRTYAFPADAAGPGLNPVERFFDNPSGGSVALGDYVWGWQGTRITLLEEWAGTTNAGRQDERSTDWRLDVKNQLSLGMGRRVTAFYNTIDYEETKYGARFRGNDSDYVREVTAGDFRRESGVAAQPVELYGGSLWLQAGPKTERFKRSRVTLSGLSGEIRSRKTYESFAGARSSFAFTVRDVDYARRQFFALGDSLFFDPAARVEVFADDGSASGNTPMTLRGATIAGVTGDFDPLVPAEEFALDMSTRALRLMRPAGRAWTVVARASDLTRTAEAVLQTPGATTARENVYLLGVQGTIPTSFVLSIRDSSGLVEPLARYGLDDDGNGSADPGWIDYQQGILHFPGARPFEPEVYDSIAPRSVHVLDVRGQTSLSILQLGRRNLVRESETVRLDGTAAARGNDFVLDYTNGVLVFVRDGIVNPDTRIEVEYEYYEATGEQLDAASVSYAPSDMFFLQGDWQKRSRDSTHLVSLQGEIRETIGAFDLRFVPLASYQTDQQALTRGGIEGFVSSGWLRVQGSFASLSSAFSDLYRPRAVFGDVRQQAQVSAAVDLRQDLRFSGNWSDAQGYASPSSAGSPYDRSTGAGLLFHRQDFPGLEASVRSQSTRWGDSTSAKRVFLGLFEYQLPSAWSNAILLQGLRLEQSLRLGTQEDRWASGMARGEFLQSVSRVNASFTEQIQAGLFYRSSTVNDKSSPGQELPRSAYERFLADVSLAEWRAVQLYVRMENTLDQQFHQDGVLNDYLLRTFNQVNIRLSPGQVWSALRMLYLELTSSRFGQQADRTSGPAGSYLWRVSVPGDGTGSQAKGNTTFLRAEIRPDERWLLSSLAEQTRSTSAYGLTALEREFRQFTQKVDVRAGYRTRVTAQYRLGDQDIGAGRRYRWSEPSLWLEQRWTPDLQTTLYGLYRRTDALDRTISGVTHDIQSSLDIVYRRDAFLGMRHVELRQNLSGTSSRSGGAIPATNAAVQSTSAVDLYPVHSLIIRFRFDYALYSGPEDYARWASTLRLSLQL